ncbi:Uncharacterised protein [Mycobacterium tuberculosis]|nr:Uncharacterised protein [Mycobacterium tuberculosis]
MPERRCSGDVPPAFGLGDAAADQQPVAAWGGCANRTQAGLIARDANLH